MPKLMIDGLWRGDMPDRAALRACRIVRGRLAESVTREDAAEPGRFHLYVSYACPFAHRAILARTLLGLEDRVGMSVLHPRWNTLDGWVFGEAPLATPDLGGQGWTHLHQAYRAADPAYTGKVTVPVLWDRATGRIASNESAVIVRLFADLFAPPEANPLYPVALLTEIEAWNDAIGQDLAAGVYAVASAANQAEYDGAIGRVFALLDRLEARFGDGRPFLHGASPTAGDIFLFTPLARFDAVYNPLFRVSLRRLADYRSLSAWARRFLAVPGVAGTLKFEHILRHYHDGDWGVATRAGIVPALPTTGPFARACAPVQAGSANTQMARCRCKDQLGQAAEWSAR